MLKLEKKISTLELVEQINVFRSQMEDKKPLLHKNLLRIVRDEFEDEIASAQILAHVKRVPTNNGGSKEITIYELTIDQAKQVLMRESKVVRKAMIRYLNELEEKVKQLQKTPMQIAETMNSEQLGLLISVVKEKEVAEGKLLEQKPMVDAYKTISNSKKLSPIDFVAGLFDFGRNNFYKLLTEEGILKKTEFGYKPYQRYLNTDYFDFKVTEGTNSKGVDFVTYKTLVTGKGILWLSNKLGLKFKK